VQGIVAGPVKTGRGIQEKPARERKTGRLAVSVGQILD
jgi:hypothetical protein